MSLVAGTRLGPYEIIAPLGAVRTLSLPLALRFLPHCPIASEPERHVSPGGPDISAMKGHRTRAS